MLAPTLLASLLLISSHVVLADPTDGYGKQTYSLIGQAYCQGLGESLYSYGDASGNSFCGCTAETTAPNGGSFCTTSECIALASYTGTSTTLDNSSGACLDFGDDCGADQTCPYLDLEQTVLYENGCPTGQVVGVSADGATCVCTTDTTLACATVENGYASCSVSAATDSTGAAVSPYPIAFCSNTCNSPYVQNADGNCVLPASAGAGSRRRLKARQDTNKHKAFIF
ncbi:Prosolanapyrone synthase [Pseudohyphozyma bogoriensis]|nr:Prosolanapyrone synthase [Pseudohyphozyma bogoriensis]